MTKYRNIAFLSSNLMLITIFDDISKLIMNVAQNHLLCMTHTLHTVRQAKLM